MYVTMMMTDQIPLELPPLLNGEVAMMPHLVNGEAAQQIEARAIFSKCKVFYVCPLYKAILLPMEQSLSHPVDFAWPALAFFYIVDFSFAVVSQLYVESSGKRKEEMSGK
ncbi:fibronectin type III domain-containing protein 3B [Cricetulus griseus]|nr:fibronectin type III domain-containing protein 3B [Cricetulus griseus]